MSLWTRSTNMFRGDRLSREIREEMEAHIAEAIEQGRDAEEARRAFGSMMRHGEASRDARLVAWLDSLRADAVFGWRQLMKRKVTSAAAVLSLALAIGACTSAFRLIDALLLRPLPVAEPDHLYALYRQGVGFTGKFQTFDSWAYPDFQLMRAAVRDRAELIAVSYAEQTDVTYRSEQEMEKAYLQYVSGWMFGSFGLRPALGRLFTGEDDRKPGAHPYAVISYDYWTRRFGRDPEIVGRTFRMSGRIFEIVGVSPEPFTGTETGVVTDVFLPTMMHPGALHDDWTWHRTLARIQPGTALGPLRQSLNATSQAFERERAKGFKGMTKESIDKFLNQTLELQPAAAGASDLQQDYGRSLVILGMLVGLVLLIACANVANLMTAQAAARAREMALRISIGAGRWRLVRLVLVESAWLAILAGAAGALFAWWSAPFVVSRINPPDNPARLFLPADWRVVGFGAALTVGVMLLFGLAPALRASAIQPSAALKGGSDPHTKRRLMHGLIGLQVAFCFLVLFLASLFTETFERLSGRPMGFSAERLLAVDAVAEQGQLPVFWEQAAQRLRAVPGVERVAVAGWPLLGHGAWNGFVSVNGAPPGPVLAYFLSVSPGWIDAMKIHLIAGRDFRPSETSPGSAIVNEAFAREYFAGKTPIGKVFARGDSRYEVVGLTTDAPYRSVREPVVPVAYVPFQAVDGKGAQRPLQDATFMVRTAGANPMELGATLRHEVAARAGFRVSRMRTQADLVRAQTIRERLLAMLGLFFAGVALLLAGIGLYGVLDYSVLQRRREIGIRVAIGAPAGNIARLVIRDVFAMVLAGGMLGVLLGMGSARYVQALLYQVKPTEAGPLLLPSATILAAALLAAAPAVYRALRIDPVEMLRAE